MVGDGQINSKVSSEPWYSRLLSARPNDAMDAWVAHRRGIEIDAVILRRLTDPAAWPATAEQLDHAAATPIGADLENDRAAVVRHLVELLSPTSCQPGRCFFLPNGVVFGINGAICSWQLGRNRPIVEGWRFRVHGADNPWWLVYGGRQRASHQIER